MADGRLGKCKSCTKKDVSNNRAKNVDRIREYDRERWKLEARRASDRARRKTPKRRDWEKRYQKTPTRKRIDFAHKKVRQALVDGVLVKKPCEVCREKKVQAHHDDYSKPLDVRWLCSTHHVEHHRKMKKKGIGG